MKEKGFTLIELLTVIVILAIIALIATPLILGVIQDVRDDGFRNSVRAIFKAVEIEMGTDTEIKSGNVVGLQLKGDPFGKGTWEYNEATQEVILSKVALKNGTYCIGRLSSKDQGTRFSIGKNCDNIIDLELPENISLEQGSSYSLKIATVKDTKGFSYHYGSSAEDNVIIVKHQGKEIPENELDTYVETLGVGEQTFIYYVKDQYGNDFSKEYKIEITQPFLVDVVKVGDYVSYVPVDSTKATLAKNAGGWRVLGKSGAGSTGVVNLVTANPTENYSISYNGATDGYKGLLLFGPKYVDNNFADSGRLVNKKDLTAFGPSGEICHDNFKYLPTNDLTYNNKNYWVLEPPYVYATSKNLCYVDWNSNYSKVMVSGTEGSATKGVRPVVVLKAGVKGISGTGSKEDPFVLGF